MYSWFGRPAAEDLLGARAVVGRRPGRSVDEDHVVALAPPASREVVAGEVEAHHVPAPLGVEDHVIVVARRVQPVPDRLVHLVGHRAVGRPAWGSHAASARLKVGGVGGELPVVGLVLDVVPEHVDRLLPRRTRA